MRYNDIHTKEFKRNFFKNTLDLKLALGSMMGNVKRKNEKGSVRNDVY